MLPGYSVWIEIQANKATISDARKFRTAMQHCAEAGVDAVLLSVRDTSGYVLYPSTLAPSYSEYDPTFAPGVDYLRQCLEICRQEGIALYAAMDVFVGGNRNDPSRRCRHYGTRTGRRKCMDWMRRANLVCARFCRPVPCRRSVPSMTSGSCSWIP